MPLLPARERLLLLCVLEMNPLARERSVLVVLGECFLGVSRDYFSSLEIGIWIILKLEF